MKRTYKKNFTVTVGIPTLNAQKNIKRVLMSLLNQKEDRFTLKKIIVFSDGSHDKTAEITRSVKDNRIKIVVSSKTRGFAFGVQKILSLATTDVIVILNDDVMLVDNLALSRLVAPFNDGKTGLACGNIIPLTPETFIEKAVFSSFKAFSRIKLELNSGNNVYTCDAKVLAFSHKFAQKVDLFKEPVGNVDLYLYFLCLKSGFHYQYVKEDTIYFRLPQTAKDLFNQTQRANISRSIVTNKYTDMYIKEVNDLRIKLYLSILWETIKNPIGAIAVFFINRFGKYIYGNIDHSFEKWAPAGSTKNI